MRTPAPPEHLLKKPVGCMALAYWQDSVSVFVREDARHVGDYPQQCSVELMLRSWVVEPIIAVAALARFAKRELMTYQSWINVGDASGARLIKNLSDQSHVNIHLLTTKIARTFKIPNAIQAEARTLANKVAAELLAWDQADFDKVRAQLDHLYPTASAMWQAWRNTPGQRNELGAAATPGGGPPQS